MKHLHFRSLKSFFIKVTYRSSEEQTGSEKGVHPQATATSSGAVTFAVRGFSLALAALSTCGVSMFPP